MIAILLALSLIRQSPLETWKAETLCWESGYCQPRVVYLGTWN